MTLFSRFRQGRRRSRTGKVDEQPSRSLWQRVENVFSKFFPGDMY